MTTNRNDQEQRNRANESAKKAKSLSPSIQYAMVTVMPNIINGAFWGFVDMKSIQEHIEAIQHSDGNVVARKLGNACLLECNPNYLVKAISAVDSNALAQGDINKMQQARAEAQIAFEKFLISKGKTSEKTGKPFGGTVGIYCTNDVTSIVYKGTNYPAFRVDMITALSLLNKYGYKIRVSGQFVTAQQAQQSGQALWDSTVLAPTKTGIFIDIQCTYSAAQIKELEKQFKIQYGVK